MEWSDFKVFLQVVRHGTIAAASASLGMDHSTISRRIARLEREAGVKVFERAARRLTLTEAGRQMAEAAERLESIILREVASLSEKAQVISGPVRIGATEDFGVHYLAPRLARLAGEHAGLEIELVTAPRAQSLAAREVDVLVTMDRPSSGDIRFRKLTSFALGFYGAPGYFGGSRRPASADDLRGETWCGYIGELLPTPELDLTQAEAGGFPARYRTSGVSAQLAAVLGGAALAALPCFVARGHRELERLIPGAFTFVRTYWLAVHEDLADSPRIRAVMNAIDEQVRLDRALFHDTPSHDAPRVERAADQTDPAKRRAG